MPILPTKTVEISTLEELSDFAKTLLSLIEAPSLILLKGSLGTGKTALVKKLLKHLSVPENKVKSPTFSLINLFPLKNYYLAHLDLYRLDEPDIYLIEEIKEILEHPKSVVMIEWAEKLGLQSSLNWQKTFPSIKQIITIEITFQQKNFRKISIYVKSSLNT